MIYIAGIALVLVVLVLVRRVKPREDPAPAPARAREVGEITAGLTAHRRTAYLPETVEEHGPQSASRFSGAPYLAPGEAWPACGNCARPMQLFVQLAGDELPAEAQSRIAPGELFQLFYCTNEDPLCENECDAWAPHARSTLLRIVAAGAEPPDGPSMPEGMFPTVRIAGWTAADDYPNFEELDDLGVQLADADLDALGEEYPRLGDKLLGWPGWVQSVEYPACRVCGRRMELLFQVDSEQNLPYSFGDVGTGHVTQCPEHRTELAFGWACY